MEKVFKKSNWTDIIVSFLFIIVGLMLLAKPDVIMSMISIILGTICIIMGVLKGIDYLANDKEDSYLLAMAIVA